MHNLKRRVFMLVVFLSLLAAGNAAFAARKSLQAPPIATFTPEQYLDETYKTHLGALILDAEKLGDANISSALRSLYKATRKDKSLLIIQGIENGLLQYKETNPVLYSVVSTQLSSIKAEVDDESFNRHHDGIDFQVDMPNVSYMISWLDDSGKEVIKRVPMTPFMDIVVKGEYLPVKRDNNEVYVYRYWVLNGAASSTRISDLYLENKFLQSYLKNTIERRFGKMSPKFKVSDNVKLSVFYPQGNLNYFTFYFSRIKEETQISIKQGQQNDYPFELEEIDGSIAGIIECSVLLFGRDYKPYMNLTTNDPSMAMDIFVSADKTRFFYKGNTVGPVPVPATFDKAKFIDQIITYNTQAVGEGWNDNQEVINFTTQGLTDIKGNLNNKDQVRLFITTLEGYYKAIKILSEAYVLLKYNLEYLLSKM
jgi:hypothetical protein